MRAGPLSDDRVIKAVNDSFITVEINVTRDGFPVDAIPALRHYQAIYQQNWRFEFGFANCSAVSSPSIPFIIIFLLRNMFIFIIIINLKVEDTGTIPLGLAKPKGAGVAHLMEADIYLDFLSKALGRFNRVRVFVTFIFVLLFWF